jgi:hypothetical protein
MGHGVNGNKFSHVLMNEGHASAVPYGTRTGEGFRVCVRTPFPTQSRGACPELVERGRLHFRPVQIGFFRWPIWTAHEAFIDPKRLGKRLSNEGHGFSRAVKGLRLTALAAEVRFSRHTG